MNYHDKNPNTIDWDEFCDVVRAAAEAALLEFPADEREAEGAAAVEHALKRVKIAITAGIKADPAELARNSVLDFVDMRHGRPSRRLHPGQGQAQQAQAPGAKTPPKLKFINGNALRAMPKKEPWFLVEGVIQGRKVSLLMGEDGSGKSMLMLMLLLAVATGGNWLGLGVRRGPVIFLTAEEEADDVWERIAAIEDTLDRTFDLKDFHLVVIDENLDESDEGLVLGAPGADRKIQMTDLWNQLVAGIETIKPVAVGLDPLVEIFDGDEMVRVQARQFVAPMRKIARKRDLALYLAGHPSKTSAQSKTGTAGTTGWSAATRGRQFLEIVYDDDNNDTGKRKLHVKKVTGGKAGFARPLADHTGLKLGDTRHLLQQKPAGCALDRRHVDEANLDVSGRRLATGRSTRRLAPSFAMRA